MMPQFKNNINSAALPYDYEVSWLKSDGLQYVDTGIAINRPGYKFTVELMYGCFGLFHQMKADGIWIGFEFNENHHSNFDAYGGDYSKMFGGKTLDMNVMHHAVYEYTESVSKLTIDNNFIASIQSNVSGNLKTNTVNFGLMVNYDFNTHKYELCDRCKSCFRSMKIEDIEDNKTLFDGIAVVKDGIGCIYDKISKKLLMNAGTGQFVIGERI